MNAENEVLLQDCEPKMTQELTAPAECVLSALGDNNKVRRSCAFERIGLSMFEQIAANNSIAALVGTIAINSYQLDLQLLCFQVMNGLLCVIRIFVILLQWRPIWSR